MRTLLAGEFDLSTSDDADHDVKVEVENGSGTFKDLRSLLGYQWAASLSWGEHVDTKVATATITLVQRIGAETQTLAPLIESSVLNVLDDTVTYSPLIDVGRLIRFSTATVPHGQTVVSGDFRAGFTGRITRHRLNDQGGLWAGPIVLECSDLGAWLMDLQIESSGVEYGDPDAPPNLEDVLQAVIDDNLPAGDPAVTVVKQSSSSFAVTGFRTGDTKVLEALNTLVLDSVGEDIRYRFNSSHVSTLQWFDPDRDRVTVDATFPKESYILRTLDTAIDDVRNAGAMDWENLDDSTTGTVTQASDDSIAAYRRRWFRLAAHALITSEAEAQVVLDAVVNDLSAPLAEAEAVVPYCWFVQLFDRYTFEANGRQYSDDQTLSVVGYRHSIENGRATTTLQLAGRVVGAYSEWLKRIRSVNKRALTDADNSLTEIRYTDASDGSARTYTWRRGINVAFLAFYEALVDLPLTDNAYPLASAVADIGTILPAATNTWVAVKPPFGKARIAIAVPHYRVGQGTHQGAAVKFGLEALSRGGITINTSVTEDTSAGTGTLTVVVTDPQSSIGEDRIQFYETVNGTRTLEAATTSPGGGATAGTYTRVSTLDPRHNVKVEPVVTWIDDTTEVLGAWTFDLDRRANCVSLSQAIDSGTASVLALFDTDTAIGATNARWRVDAGSWTEITVAADRSAAFTLPVTSAIQEVDVQGKDADGNWGPSNTVQIPPSSITTVAAGFTTVSITASAAPDDNGAGTVTVAFAAIGVPTGTTYDIAIDVQTTTGGTVGVTDHSGITSGAAHSVPDMYTTSTGIITVFAVYGGDIIATGFVEFDHFDPP